MATFQYTPTQNSVRSTPTMYDVQVNRTVERGFQNLENAMLGAMKLKTAVNEDTYRKQQLDQKNTINQFAADWDAASYEQQQEMYKQLPSLVLDKYQGEDRYTQQLRSNGIAAISQFESALAKTGKQVEHNNNITAQNVAYIDMGNRFNETQDIAGKQAIVSSYYESNVAPYEGIDDPQAQDLYNRGLENWNRLDAALKKTVQTRADNKITTDVMASLQVELQMNGWVNGDRYDQMKANLARRSDWEDNKGKILEEFDRAVLMGMRGMFNDPNVPKTSENAQLYMQRLDEFVKKTPTLVGKSYFNDAVMFGNTLKNAADSTDLTSMRAMLSDDTVSITTFKSTLDNLRSRNLLTDEQVSSFTFDKQQKLVESNVKPQISNMIQRNDFAGLQKIYAERGESVRTVLKDTFAIAFSKIKSEYGESAASITVLQQYKAFKDNGIDAGSLPFIDEVLNRAQTVGFETEGGVRDFINTYELAHSNGYQKGLTTTASKNYTILKTWEAMGMPDMASKWTSFKEAPVRVSDADVDEQFLKILDSDDTFSENLSGRNLRAMSDILKPALRAAMKAGIDPEELGTAWETVVDSNYLRVDPKWGGSSEVLIRKHPDSAITDEKQYTRAFDAAEKELGVSLGYLAPKDPTKPTGEWVAWDDKGAYYIIPYADIADASVTGIWPKK